MPCLTLSQNHSGRALSLKRTLAIGTLALGVLGTLLCTPVPGVRLPNNRIVFDRSPELVEAVVLPTGPDREGQFQIVINLPDNAGEPLEALVVHPRETEICFPFDPTATEAYFGKPGTDLAAIPLASVGGVMMSPNEVLVVFMDPVAPGNQVTVRLLPKVPPAPGIYEFSVTVYPSGDNPVGQFLGYETIQF